MNLAKLFLPLALCGTCLLATSSLATTVDLTSGTTGSNTPVPQSFNETRGVDVTVLGGTGRVVSSMTLRGLAIYHAPATVGARIYDTATSALIASGNVGVPFGSGQTVTVPVSALLQPGQTYRICFFVSAASFGGGAILFLPSAGFPYTENTGELSILGAYDGAADAFPADVNLAIPLMSVDLTDATAAPGPRPVLDAWSVEPMTPNPLRDIGSVEFRIPQRSRIVLDLFDAAGQRVRTMAAELEAGRHRTWVEKRGLPAGLYLLRFKAISESGALSFVAVRRFVVLGS